ncbi:MAG: discoidin domain-containing protein, partial [Planctomycetes bacterium]|nr:discoidin domain-containing protein [Planctomycetota bacterium]
MCKRSIHLLSLVLVLASGLFLAAPVGAVAVKVSNFGNAHQIWFEVEAYDQRDPDTDAYFKVVDADGAFGKAVTRTGAEGGMLRYTFDIAQADGKGGTWYFWGRVIVPNNDSDFLVVEGIPGEPVLPASPPYPGTSSAPGFSNAQRIFDENLGPPWTWGRSGHGDGHTRRLKDGRNTMTIVHRQGNNANFWDVFLWTDSPAYVPTDNDYRNARTVLAGGASHPQPAAGATDVAQDAALSWTPGTFAGRHDVYLGTDLAAVTAATAADPGGIYRGRIDPNTYTAPLAFGQTYYWRIDEVNRTPDNSIFKGAVWSFTVEPYAYPITKVTAIASTSQAGMGPEKTIDGSGLNSAGQHGNESSTMWLSTGAPPNWIQYAFDRAQHLYEMRVWNSNQAVEPFIGFGARRVKIEISPDGAAWTELPGVPEFARATGLPTYTSNTTVAFGGVSARYVKLTVNSPWGMAPQTGLSEVRFFSIPVQAYAPQPPDGATGIGLDAVLNWRPGRQATSHQIYLGTDKQAVAEGTAPVQTLANHMYDPPSLQLATTYYWRVDEVNATTIPGEVWSFTTQEYEVVDDFESYTNDEGNRIYETWADGFGSSNNGSQVGYAQAPFAERRIIHGGTQSMPLSYSNAGAITLSEATRTFDRPQNWTANGIKSLSLWFQGIAGNNGQLYVKINNTKVAYTGNAGDIAKLGWIPWNVDLSTVSINDVTKLTIGVEGAGAKGLVFIDDIRLYPKAPAFFTPADPGKTNLKALYAFEGNANDTSG